jgi:hypothetical protein
MPDCFRKGVFFHTLDSVLNRDLRWARDQESSEPRKGNSSVDSGESDWQSAPDTGLKVFITEPKASSNVP